MIDIDTIYTTLDDVYKSDNILDTLVEFERVFDQLDLYVYKNWKHGEIVEGPRIDRHWITVSIMYPYKLMPDPDGALRLEDHGCKVWFSTDTLRHVARVSPDQETDKKIIENKVWVVKISMPRHFVDQIKTDKIDVGDDKVDMDDVTDAYDQELTGDNMAKGIDDEEK